MPDGIEAKLQALGKRPLSAADLGKQAKAVEEAAYVIAAIGEVAQVKAPDKDKDKWKGWAEDMIKASHDLAKAAKAKDAAGIKSAATKVDGACTACHEKFR